MMQHPSVRLQLEQFHWWLLCPQTQPGAVQQAQGRRKGGGGGGGQQQLRSPVVKRPAAAPVTLQGWLHKQGSEGFMLWKRRWFVLSEYCLFYYKGSYETHAQMKHGMFAVFMSICAQFAQEASLLDRLLLSRLLTCIQGIRQPWDSTRVTEVQRDWET
jgi:hypothetical protein